MKNWIGPRYSFKTWGTLDTDIVAGRFINKEAYPKEDHQALEKLIARYREYYCMATTLGTSQGVPNPFNMGDEWYLAVETFIITGLRLIPGDPRHFGLWKGICKDFLVFRNDNVQTAMDEYQWGMWSEGIALMGFDS